MTAVLAFDTSAGGCSAAVLDGEGDVLAQRSERRDRGHAERLMPLLREVLGEARLAFSDLALLAVTVGPGTFTGIRIGLAAAQGLALAGQLPLVGVTSLAAVADAVPASDRAGRTVVVALDSRRADLFVQLFGATGALLTDPGSVTPDQLPDRLPPGELLIAGDGAHLAEAALVAAGRRFCLAPSLGPPDPVSVGRLALAYRRAGIASPARPLYLRPPDVTLPGRPG